MCRYKYSVKKDKTTKTPKPVRQLTDKEAVRLIKSIGVLNKSDSFTILETIFLAICTGLCTYGFFVAITKLF